MHKVLWRRVRGGTPGARLFAAYMAIVMAIALIGPGLAVYAAEGEATETPAPVVEEPAVEVPEEPVAEEPVVEEPAVEPEAEEPAVEPEAEPEALGAAVEPAAIVDPIVIENPTGPPDEGCERIEDPDHEEAMTYTIGDAEILVTLSEDDDGWSLCFEVLTEGYAVSEVVVKGGPDANVYEYDPPVTEDCGLHAPALASNGLWPEVSYIDFCVTEIDVPEVGDLEVCKFEDLDGDGEWDEDEPWLEGWEFVVTDSEDNELDSGTTGEDGCVTFEDLPVGDVWVTETLMEGWENTTELTQMAEIVEGETATLLFGNMREEEPPETGDLEVCKFEDLDGDGEWDEGEPGLEGWEFTVYDEEDNEIDSGMTGEDGCIVWEGLDDGMMVTVVETMQEGWVPTTETEQSIEIVAGETVSLHFGNMMEEETGALLVHKFEDLDGDGEWDEDEPLLEGWEFTVWDEAMENILDSGMTGEDGTVLFEDLPVGAVVVVETLMEGWMNTTDLEQDALVVADSTTHVFFGNERVVEPPEFGDVVVLKFHDMNRNGVQDAGEGMLAGWEFKLYKNGMLVGTAVTNAAGRIDWPDLESGTYTAIETPRSGWTNTTPLSRTFVVVENQTVTLLYGNVEVEQPFAPFTPSSPFLPFTGGDLLLLLGAAAAAATAGTLLRRRA